MAKAVADRWLDNLAHGEYRFTLFGFRNAGHAKKFASVLRSLRDRPVKTGSSDSGRLAAVPDLGVRERGEFLEVWSSDVDGLRRIAKWAETSGLNSDFIW